MIKLLKRIVYITLLFCTQVNANDNYTCDENCTFVLMNEQNGIYQVVNQARSEQRFSPFSTFKIPNSLIAIETGIVKNLTQKWTLDLTKYPIQKWWSKKWYQNPLTIKQAFKYSAMPIYQQIASQIGERDMQKYVSDFNYGNADISSGIDTFWLSGSLKITAREQVDFLQKLYNHKLPVSENTMAFLKDIMLVESTENYKLYAKTGGGYMDSGLAVGWYVGFVENNLGVHYFALNMQAETFSDLKTARIDIARQQLKKAGVIK